MATLLFHANHHLLLLCSFQKSWRNPWLCRSENDLPMFLGLNIAKFVYNSNNYDLWYL